VKGVITDADGTLWQDFFQFDIVLENPCLTTAMDSDPTDPFSVEAMNTHVKANPVTQILAAVKDSASTDYGPLKDGLSYCGARGYEIVNSPQVTAFLSI
jgi:hypothetical protein